MKRVAIISTLLVAGCLAGCVESRETPIGLVDEPGLTKTEGQVLAEGSSAQKRAMDLYGIKYATAVPGARLSYPPAGSGEGQTNFLAGTVDIAGKSIAAYSAKALAKQMSIVLTRPITVQQLCVNELVALGRYPYTDHWGRLTSHDETIVMESLSLVGMQAFSQRKVGTLSDGERQKVMIAKALAQQTAIILLDEPTAFLDFPSKIDMLKLLKHLAHRLQKTILLSTHDLAFALKMADNLWLMQAGKLHEGTPKQLADIGLLANYIHQKGVTFNPQTMEISYQPKVDI